MKNLWVRLGVSLHLTDEEVEFLMKNDKNMKKREEIIYNVISEKRFEINGECYAPADSIGDFNDAYGTAFEKDDYDFFW